MKNKTLVVLGLVALVLMSHVGSLRPYRFPKLLFFPPMPHSPSGAPSQAGVELGQMLFNDSLLSRDSSMSCASCHQQKYAFSSPQNVENRLNGQQIQRNVLPLFNLAWYRGFFWDGRVSELEQVALHPVRNPFEMNLDWPNAQKRIQDQVVYRRQFQKVYGAKTIDSLLIAHAIGQYMRTLISYQSKFDRVLAGKEWLNESEYRGFVLMNDMSRGDCLHCHTTDGDALGTIGSFANSGLDAPSNLSDSGRFWFTKKTTDIGRFKIPSLRNLAFTAPYMHDGRFQTLREVLDFYSNGVRASSHTDPRMTRAHNGGVGLTHAEIDDILNFLATMNDSVFVGQRKMMGCQGCAGGGM